MPATLANRTTYMRWPSNTLHAATWRGDGVRADPACRYTGTLLTFDEVGLIRPRAHVLTFWGDSYLRRGARPRSNRTAERGSPISHWASATRHALPKLANHANLNLGDLRRRCAIRQTRSLNLGTKADKHAIRQTHCGAMNEMHEKAQCPPPGEGGRTSALAGLRAGPPANDTPG